jgi:hypothetical protein
VLVTLGQAGGSVSNVGAAHARTGATIAFASHLEQGLIKAEIARTLDVSRQTLDHCVNTEQLDRDWMVACFIVSCAYSIAPPSVESGSGKSRSHSRLTTA